MRTYVIAEAGVNHNGDVDRAVALIDAAVAAGADCVKFQTFVPEELISRRAGKAEYQKATTDPAEGMLDMCRSLALDTDAHHRLIGHCRTSGIDFLSTPFDLPSVDLLTGPLRLRRIKLPSGEITNLPLLLRAARSGAAIILSTGMSVLGEVERALAVLAFGYLDADSVPSIAGCLRAFATDEARVLLRDKLVLLHCTTEYPAPFADVNLKAMDTLAQAFGLPVGLSDHTPGIAIPIAAVARGAAIIEKHFTLDRRLPGPDHQASLEPDELAAMVAGIRAVDLAMGDGIKRPAASERKNIGVARKCLVARRTIRAGDRFDDSNLTAKRGDGSLPADLYWDWLGRVAVRGYEADQAIEP